jgi:hypothetical protein
MAKKYLKNICNQKGQALFEMILFLPFLMFLYTIYYTAGNAISGSINQQKAVRGYFYTLVKGNSYIVTLNELKSFRDGTGNITNVGFNSVGWDEHLVNQNPIAPCFKFLSLLKNNSEEVCEEKQTEEGQSRFIRLFTYYGVCGATYTQNAQDREFFDIDPRNQASQSSCTLGH